MEIQVLTFAEAKQPEYKEKKGEGYMQYGQNNDYPQYLLDLFNKSAKHNAIVRNKVNYIVGNGWAGEDAIVKKVNREESLNDLTKKVALDLELDKIQKGAIQNIDPSQATETFQKQFEFLKKEKTRPSHRLLRFCSVC